MMEQKILKCRNKKSKHTIARRFLSLMMLLCMIIQLNVPVKAASSASVSIGLSASSIKMGDSVTATIKVKTGNMLGSFSMAVTYDASVLQYTSGGGSGGNGTISIAGYGDGSTKSSTVSLSFKAIGNGSTTIKTSGGEVYDWDENACSISHAGATVNVKSEATASTDCKLSALQISPGNLSPSFQKDHTSYTATVASDVSNVVVSASPSNSKASVSVSGNKNLKEGNNTVKVTVTAESGAQKTYTISVNKKKKDGQEGTTQASNPEDGTTEHKATEQSSSTEETSATETTSEKNETPKVLIDGKEYTFAEEYETLDIPEGFSPDIAAYDGREVLAFSSEMMNYLLVCLLDAEGNPYWYIYDAKTNGFTVYMEIVSSSARYLILSPDETVKIPQGYEPVSYAYGGGDVNGYTNTKDDNGIILVYAVKSDGGEPQFYLFDLQEKSFVRFIEGEYPAAMETIENLDGDAVYSDNNWLNTVANWLVLHIGILNLCIILLISLLITVILLLAFVFSDVQRRKLKKSDKEKPESEESETGVAKKEVRKAKIEAEKEARRAEKEAKRAEKEAKKAERAKKTEAKTAGKKKKDTEQIESIPSIIAEQQPETQKTEESSVQQQILLPPVPKSHGRKSFNLNDSKDDFDPNDSPDSDDEQGKY